MVSIKKADIFSDATVKQVMMNLSNKPNTSNTSPSIDNFQPFFSKLLNDLSTSNGTLNNQPNLENICGQLNAMLTTSGGASFVKNINNIIAKLHSKDLTKNQALEQIGNEITAVSDGAINLSDNVVYNVPQNSDTTPHANPIVNQMLEHTVTQFNKIITNDFENNTDISTNVMAAALFAFLSLSESTSKLASAFLNVGKSTNAAINTLNTASSTWQNLSTITPQTYTTGGSPACDLQIVGSSGFDKDGNVDLLTIVDDALAPPQSFTATVAANGTLQFTGSNGQQLTNPGQISSYTAALAKAGVTTVPANLAAKDVSAHFTFSSIDQSGLTTEVCEILGHLAWDLLPASVTSKIAAMFSDINGLLSKMHTAEQTPAWQDTLKVWHDIANSPFAQNIKNGDNSAWYAKDIRSLSTDIHDIQTSVTNHVNELKEYIYNLSYKYGSYSALNLLNAIGSFLPPKAQNDLKSVETYIRSATTDVHVFLNSQTCTDLISLYDALAKYPAVADIIKDVTGNDKYVDALAKATGIYNVVMKWYNIINDPTKALGLINTPKNFSIAATPAQLQTITNLGQLFNFFITAQQGTNPYYSSSDTNQQAGMAAFNQFTKEVSSILDPVTGQSFIEQLTNAVTTTPAIFTGTVPNLTGVAAAAANGLISNLINQSNQALNEVGTLPISLTMENNTNSYTASPSAIKDIVSGISTGSSAASNIASQNENELQSVTSEIQQLINGCSNLLSSYKSLSSGEFVS